MSEPPGFARFYSAELRPVLSFLYKQGASWDDCWDAAQEAFFEALRNWHKIDSPRAWVRTTALRYHVHQRQRRDDDKQRAIAAGWWAPRPPFAEIRIKGDEARILAAIAALPERQREVIAWRADGYPPVEIAHLLGLSEEAVRSSLYQARKRLKSELSDEPDGGCHER